jgi:hypothetical protein
MGPPGGGRAAYDRQRKINNLLATARVREIRFFENLNTRATFVIAEVNVAYRDEYIITRNQRIIVHSEGRMELRIRRHLGRR